MHLEEHLHWWIFTADEEEEQVHCSRWDCSYWPRSQSQCGDHWTSNQHWWRDPHHHWQLMHWLSTAMLTELLKSWKQAHWGIVIFNTCTLHHVWHLTVHVDYRRFFVIDFASFRSLHVLYRLWHWSTESMSRGSAKINMHCTHTTAHSRTLSSTLTAWLKSLWKRLTESTLDWRELLTASCVGERSLNYSVGWC